MYISDVQAVHQNQARVNNSPEQTLLHVKSIMLPLHTVHSLKGGGWEEEKGNQDSAESSRNPPCMGIATMVGQGLAP